MIRRKIRKLFNNKIKHHGSGIDPDEIFLDAHNLPQFDVQQFEGVLERPIAKRVIIFVGIIFAIIGSVFMWRISMLQIANGESFAIRSENNRLKHMPIFADRGVVHDRNGVELAWNIPGEHKNALPVRAYIDNEGFGHLLGYVKPPLIDKNGYYYREEFEGIIGVESVYNSELGGSNGLKITETDALGDIISESVIEPPHDGENITLSIDAKVQEKLYKFIKSTALDRDFNGGAGIIMDVSTGELVAITSYPEYDSAVLSEGENDKLIASYNENSQKPFLDRAISGLYTPGSIVKPFIALGALNEGVVTPSTSILSTGSISIQNPYFPDLFSVFTDWKAHGWVNIKEALAVSSNVYFYEVGGGYEDQKGIGIEKIENYVRKFGLGEATHLGLSQEPSGLIPNPAWKAETFDGEPWRIGDTYNTAIGQYGFQATPLQMVRAISAIANDGIFIESKIISGEKTETRQIDIPKEHFDIVKSGMRLAVTNGTALGLNVSAVSIAAKTGTAEVGIEKKKVNSWVVGFFPYENPRYAFAVVMEEGSRENTIGGLFVMRQLIDWMAVNTPEYLKGVE